MSFDISKIPRMKKAWGVTCPPQLDKIAKYLSAEGWTGVFDSSSAELLVFEKELFDDYSLLCFLNKVYEYPVGVVNFQTQLRLSSRSLGLLANEVFGNELGCVFDDYEIFSIGLQDLKWNDNEEGGSPVWAASLDVPKSNWIDDWERYAKTIIDRLANEEGVVDFCVDILSYQKKPWVKSDGYNRGATLVVVALLLIKNNQLIRARDFLSQAVDGGGRREKLILQYISERVEGGVL